MSTAAPVLSPKISLPQSVAIRFGMQTHPSAWAMKEGSSQTITYNTGDVSTRRKLLFSVKPIRSPIPSVAAQQAADPNFNSFKLSYRNQLNAAFSSATFVVKLEPGMRYIPGNEILPPATEITSSIDSAGVETLTIAVPSGVPAGGKGYVIFQTKFRLQHAT